MSDDELVMTVRSWRAAPTGWTAVFTLSASELRAERLRVRLGVEHAEMKERAKRGRQTRMRSLEFEYMRLKIDVGVPDEELQGLRDRITALRRS